MHHSACQELLWYTLCQVVCLVFFSSNFVYFFGCSSLAFAVPTFIVLQDVLLIFRVQVVVRLLAHPSCLSRAPGCAVHLWVPPANSWRRCLPQISSSLFLFRLLRSSPLVSTSPEVAHLLRVHPAHCQTRLSKCLFFPCPTETQYTSRSTFGVARDFLDFLHAHHRGVRGVSGRFFRSECCVVLHVTHFFTPSS